MSEKRGFLRTPDSIVLTMTPDDHDELIISLGIAAGNAMQQGDKPRLLRIFAMLNRLEAGNSEFTPFEIAESAPAETARVIL